MLITTLAGPLNKPLQDRSYLHSLPASPYIGKM